MYSSYMTSDTYYSRKNTSIIEAVNIALSPEGQEYKQYQFQIYCPQSSKSLLSTL